MEISGANTEPFHLFHRFNEEFNRNMRIAVGALGLASQMKTTGASGKVLKLPTLGEPWGSHTLWKDVAKEIPSTKRFLTQIGIVRVFSAFEDLLIGTKAEFDRNARFKGLESSRSASQDLSNFYSELSWDDKVLKGLIPLFDYFVVIRNCIAHQSGRANGTLAELDACGDLKKSLQGWQSKRNKKLPPLPSITVGKEIPLLPRHAILASEVCYRIASDINEKLRQSLGTEGLVYMAAYHALLSEDRIQTNARRFPESLINIVLTDRYRIALESKSEVIAILRSIGQWDDYRKAFEQLFPRAKTANRSSKRR
jgi:hypothetical protein